MKRSAVAIAVIGLVVCSPGANAKGGGGSWLETESHYEVGETVVASGTFSNNVEGRGKIGDGPWYGYLRQRYVPPPRTPEGAIPLGLVEIEQPANNYGIASLSFTVPQLEPGRYSIQLCNDPCTKELGDIIGGSFKVVPLGTDAWMASRLGSMRRYVGNRFRTMGYRTRRIETGLRKSLNTSSSEIMGEIDTLGRKIELLDSRTEEPPASQPSIQWWVWVIVGAAAGVMVTALLFRPQRKVTVPEEWTVPEFTEAEEKPRERSLV
jgi:hypothetical protein